MVIILNGKTAGNSNLACVERDVPRKKVWRKGFYSYLGFLLKVMKVRSHKYLLYSNDCLGADLQNFLIKSFALECKFSSCNCPIFIFGADFQNFLETSLSTHLHLNASFQMVIALFLYINFYIQARKKHWIWLSKNTIGPFIRGKIRRFLHKTRLNKQQFDQ